MLSSKLESSSFKHRGVGDMAESDVQESVQEITETLTELSDRAAT